MRQIEAKSDQLVEAHLRRNPRVVSYAGGDVLQIEYDPRIKVPMAVAAEARSLGLFELGDTR